MDFGASDAPMNDKEMQGAPGIRHIPTVAGPVCIAYNLPGVPADLHLTGPVIANIFLGTIKKWNDPQIKQLNPSAKLPATAITACHRSDGSGTTNIFTTYLAAISPAWKSGPGAGKSVNWPTAWAARATPASRSSSSARRGLGYVELTMW